MAKGRTSGGKCPISGKTTRCSGGQETGPTIHEDRQAVALIDRYLYTAGKQRSDLFPRGADYETFDDALRTLETEDGTKPLPCTVRWGLFVGFHALLGAGPAEAVRKVWKCDQPSHDVASCVMEGSTGNRKDDIDIWRDKQVLSILDRWLADAGQTKANLAAAGQINPSVLSKAFTDVSEDKTKLSTSLRIKLLRASEATLDRSTDQQIRQLWKNEAKQARHKVHVFVSGVAPSVLPILAMQNGLFGNHELSPYDLRLHWHSGDRGDRPVLFTADDVVRGVENGEATFGFGSTPAVEASLPKGKIMPVAVVGWLGHPRLCINKNASRYLQTCAGKHDHDSPLVGLTGNAWKASKDRWHLYHRGTRTLQDYVRHLATELDLEGLEYLSRQTEYYCGLGGWPEAGTGNNQDDPCVLLVKWPPHTYRIHCEEHILKQYKLKREQQYEELTRFPKLPAATLPDQADSPEEPRRAHKPLFNRNVASGADIYDACQRFKVTFTLFGRTEEVRRNRRLAMTLACGLIDAAEQFRSEVQNHFRPTCNKLFRELWDMTLTPWRKKEHYEPVPAASAEPTQDPPPSFESYLMEEFSLMDPQVCYHPEFVNELVERDVPGVG